MGQKTPELAMGTVLGWRPHGNWDSGSPPQTGSWDHTASGLEGEVQQQVCRGALVMAGLAPALCHFHFFHQIPLPENLKFPACLRKKW